ncbi:hypothetical protein DFJ73DRAFT_804616 [Zopfochytrium polystomum]|nr:hypothetical protein DFJ73DRAFT_804616 [Zopfochytrium polystomum]
MDPPPHVTRLFFIDNNNDGDDDDDDDDDEPTIHLLHHNGPANTTTTTSSSSSYHAARPWPSALVLARHLWRRALELGDLRGRAVLELGAGPGLAGLTAAYACGARRAVLTDLAADPGDPRTGRTLATLRAAVGRNAEAWRERRERRRRRRRRRRKAAAGAAAGKDALEETEEEEEDEEEEPIVEVVGLSWGDVPPAWPARADGGDPFDFDVLLGSDLIYSRAPVADLVATIAFFLWRPRAAGLPPRRCVLAYHIRSAKRSIQMLLDRWGLEARGIRDDGDVEVGKGATVLVEGCEEGEEEEVFGVGFGSVVLLEITVKAPD